MLRASSSASVAGADHAAIGDDADAGNQKAGLEPLDHRQQGGDVGGVTGPQLGTNRPPAAVDDDGEHDLLQIRAVVLRVAVLAEALAPTGQARGLKAHGALEIERGGVEEDQPPGHSPGVNRLLRSANSRSSTRSLVVRGARPRPLWSASSSPSQPIAR